MIVSLSFSQLSSMCRGPVGGPVTSLDMVGVLPSVGSIVSNKITVGAGDGKAVTTSTIGVGM